MPPMVAVPQGGAIPEGDVQGAPAPSLAPFPRAAHEYEEPFYDESRVITAGAQQFSIMEVPAYGYYRSTLFLVEAASGSGAGVVAKEDAPYNAIQSVLFRDVNGASIVGPLSGYDLFLINKYGGYTFLCDPATSPSFAAVGASGGNFSFILRVPSEITNRDALGALPNQNAASVYRIECYLNTSGNIYSTPPGTTLPTVRLRSWLEAWTQPPETDLLGRPQATVPPALGTTQFWTKFTKNISAGDQTIQLPRVGNLIRNIIYIFRTTTPARSDTNFPDPVTLNWDGRQVFSRGRAIWRHYMSERNGYPGVAGAYAAAELDTGVFVEDYTHDLDGKPGQETRDLYLATTQSARVELKGNFGAAGTLDVLTNDVAAYGGDIYAD